MKKAIVLFFGVVLLIVGTLILPNLIGSLSDHTASASTVAKVPSQKETVSPVQTETPTDSASSVSDDANAQYLVNCVEREPFDPSEFQRGLSVVLYGNDSTIEYNTSKFLEDLEKRELGVKSLIFTFPIFQDGADATLQYLDPELTPTPERVKAFVEQAHCRGYSVLIKPLLDEGRLGGRWRGSITPGGGDLSNIDGINLWFENYGKLLSQYAKIAEEVDAEAIVIGTEFVSIDKDLDKYNDNWIRLINHLRSDYSGMLTYAMNWNPGDIAEFMYHLDFLMIDAFYELYLGDDSVPSQEQMLASWWYWEPLLREYMDRGFTIMFAEVGVVPQVGSYRQPWQSNPGTAYSPEQQEAYYRATCLFAQAIGIKGLYWWAVGFYDYFESQEHNVTSFTPYDKPAEDAIRWCYQEVVTE